MPSRGEAFSGCGVALVTPFRAGAVDYDDRLLPLALVSLPVEIPKFRARPGGRSSSSIERAAGFDFSKWSCTTLLLL